MKCLPFSEVERQDPKLPKGSRVLSQRGIPGFRTHRYRVVRQGAFAVRERWNDNYPPTSQIVRVGTGDASEGNVEDDPHPEYVADEYLVLLQGPDVKGTTASVLDSSPDQTAPAADESATRAADTRWAEGWWSSAWQARRASTDGRSGRASLTTIRVGVSRRARRLAPAIAPRRSTPRDGPRRSPSAKTSAIVSGAPRVAKRRVRATRPDRSRARENGAEGSATARSCANLPPTMAHAGRKVALAVCGSIAAYKAAHVARLLRAEGIAVTPVMTRSAPLFLGPLTLSGICGAKVLTDMFDPEFAGEAHVEVGRDVDLVLVAPATADLLARLAAGRANNLVAAVAMCARGPVLLAPAMHTKMWTHPSTQRNVETLKRDGRVRFIGPVSGPLASGESGEGRLAEPEEIVAAALRLLAVRDLEGLRVVVTAGPTVEDLDPVRFLSNRSTGRMGFAVAERAAARGARVTLISGPVQLATPPDVVRVTVRGARHMASAMADALGAGLDGADALIMSAAVSDYAPREVKEHKIEKEGDTVLLELVKNPDLLAE